MTAPAADGERMVRRLAILCAPCKAALRARARGKGWSPGIRAAGCTCKRVWAPGCEPGATPPPRPNREPPVT
jgi:hypothetical protein